MNIWIIMIMLGLLTFATRLSFILLLERINLPKTLQRSLQFVPIAVLSAIVAPELVFANNTLAVSAGNPRLMAGLVAGFVAYRTKNVLLTITIGMLVFWLLKFWL